MVVDHPLFTSTLIHVSWFIDFKCALRHWSTTRVMSNCYLS